MMMLKATWSRSGLKVAATGALGLIFLCGVLGVLGFWGGSLEKQVAEEAIRQHLAWMTNQSHMAELTGSGRALPDEQTALRWAEELEAVKGLKFVDMEVKQVWFTGRLSVKKEFAVRVEVAEGGGTNVRYFRVEQFEIGSGARVKWEGSWLGWYLPL